MSFTSVDFPDPDTPVTATRQPSGISTSMFLRLCSRAPRTANQSSPGSLLIWGTGMERFLDRYWPVIDLGLASISLRGPETTISPPCSPAPGPMSTT